jgi:hypothetical protein
MRHLIILLSAVTVINTLSAQSTTNYALPANATEVRNNVSNTPEYMLNLQEGGTVPGEGQSTCDGETNGVFKSTTGLSLQHYYDEEQLKQRNTAYASIGGMKGVFLKGSEENYNDFEKGMHPGIVLKKGPLQTAELQGAVVSYFTVTYGCIQNKNTTATKTIYKALLLTENNYAQLSIEVYSANAEMARKYAEEMISKIKTLDYGRVK